MNTFDNTLCTHCVAADTAGGFLVMGYGTDHAEAYGEAAQSTSSADTLVFFHATEAAYQYARLAGTDALPERFKVENNCLFLADAEPDVDDDQEFKAPAPLVVPGSIHTIQGLQSFLEHEGWNANVTPARPMFHGEPNGYLGRGACRVLVRDPRDTTRTLFDCGFETVRSAKRFIERVSVQHEQLLEGVAA